MGSFSLFSGTPFALIHFRTRHISVETFVCMFLSFFLSPCHLSLWVLVPDPGHHGAPVYVINLLISDVQQVCPELATYALACDSEISQVLFYVCGFIYLSSLMASVGFML